MVDVACRTPFFANPHGSNYSTRKRCSHESCPVIRNISEKCTSVLYRSWGELAAVPRFNSSPSMKRSLRFKYFVQLAFSSELFVNEGLECKLFKFLQNTLRCRNACRDARDKIAVWNGKGETISTLRPSGGFAGNVQGALHVVNSSAHPEGVAFALRRPDHCSVGDGSGGKCVAGAIDRDSVSRESSYMPAGCQRRAADSGRGQF
jgi:hypothetical protein